MTHEELLKQIDDIEYPWGMQDALRAIIELHKPDESDFPDDYENCVECSSNGYLAMYPCETIKVIELNLQ